jgi:hypothetical protein
VPPASTPGDGRHREICELDAATPAAAGSAQAVTGFLAEAAGIEALLGAILRGRRSAIEVRRGGQPLLQLLVDRDAEPELAADAPPKLPFTLAFSSAAAAPVAVAAAAPLPAPAANAVALADGDGDVQACLQLAQTLARSLRARTRAIELLCAAAAVTPAQRLHGLRRDPRNLVITDPQRDGEVLRAQLQVDESHPYFFDHPLDHVPGILLLEGVLQLVELATTGATFVRSLEVRFRRYTDKHEPITLELRRDGDTLQFAARVVQAGQLVCECRVTAAHGARPAAAAPAQAMAEPHPRKRVLHKSREDNVLVGPIESHDDHLRVRTAAVPPGHLFGDGDPAAHSMLYFLEIARQCFMLVAHERLDVPFDVAMNLVELRFELDAPIPREQPLSLLPEFRSERWNGAIQTGRVTITLAQPGGVLGRAHIVSQVYDKDLYAAQRHTAAA